MRIRVAHASLQFSDTDKQHTADIEKIFDRCVDRRVAMIGGTEAGPGSGNTGDELIRVAREHGYKPWVPAEQAKANGRATDCWLAVRQDLIVGDWKADYVPVIPGSSELYRAQGLKSDLLPRWGPKGIVHASWQSIPELGRLALGVGHHLTKGQRPGPDSVIHGVDHYEWNMKLDDAFAKWMKNKGRGTALAFATMDRNASDRRNPANIKGSTTLADELKRWQNTGHGDIDWILSFNKDGRVTGVDFDVLDDREFHLHTDHFYLEGTFNVEPLKV